MYLCLPILILLLFTSSSSMAIDLDVLWDFNKPDVSEQRFRAALETATGDDWLILQTQIARTYGIRAEFDQARKLLKEIEPRIRLASAETKARFALEMGRTWASATHSSESQTPETGKRARSYYENALALAREAHLDGLAIDAIHMLAFVDPAPAAQLKWARQALAVVEQSAQPAAKRWEASIRNNLGYALHQLGHYDEALQQFRVAVKIRELGTNAEATRTAYWMVAWTLRAMGHTDEALAIQLRLERESEAAGQPDPYVFEELAALYREKGESARAQHYDDLGSASPE